jgi:hypothetical protein
MKNGAIFRNDPFEDVGVGKRTEQAAELAAGYENQSQARGSRSPKGVDRLLVHDPLLGDRSIVVGG